MNGLRFISHLSLLFTLSVVASAQLSVNGSLQGRVTDANGASIADANVTLTNAETNLAQTATTNDEGLYAFPRVAPGRYTLTVERDNFKRAARENLVITVNETATINITLEVGEASNQRGLSSSVSRSTTLAQS